MPLKDLEARRAYDRVRANTRYQPKGGSCEICGSALPDGRRKLCASADCRRRYKTQKQRTYSQPGYKKKYALSPEALERRRERDRQNGRARQGKRNSWEWNLWHVHRMRADQWLGYWLEQGGKCYLCEVLLPEDRSKIALDHEHLCCGKERSCPFCRRGLAHMHCNWLLGILGDDLAKMRPVCSDVFIANFARAQEAAQTRIAAKPEQMQLIDVVD